MVFEMLTGTAYGRMHDLKRLKEPPVALPATVFKALARALNERPSKRFPSVQAFLRALQAAQAWGWVWLVWPLAALVLACAVWWGVGPSGLKLSGLSGLIGLTGQQAPTPAWAQGLAQAQAELQAARQALAQGLSQAQQRAASLDAQATANPGIDENQYGWGREKAQANEEIKTLDAGLKALDRLLSSEGAMGSAQRLQAQAQAMLAQGQSEQAQALGQEALLQLSSLRARVSEFTQALSLKVRAQERQVQLKLLGGDFPAPQKQAFEADFNQASGAFEAGDAAQALALWGKALAQSESDLLRELPLMRQRWAQQMEPLPQSSKKYQELKLKGSSVCSWLAGACPKPGSGPKASP
jgi:hypothetical protein